VARPDGAQQRQWLALQQVDEGIVPEQDPDSQLAVLPHCALEHSGERRGLASVATQAHLGVQIPADDHDGAGCPLDRVGHGGEVALCIDQKRGPICAHPPPAVSALHQQARALTVVMHALVPVQSCRE
jgi:hypothetical protein